MTDQVAPVGDAPDRIVRKAVLVHAGPNGESASFGSADGAIDFDDARIQAVVDSQNDLIDKLAEHYGSFEKIPAGAFPPILDQHEADSTNRVIGRLTGRLSFERRSVPKVGDDVACAIADITFLGPETVDRVKDGRIFHLSIGIDEATNTLTETSAVIDPAAPGAMILKKGTKRMSKIEKSMVGGKLQVKVTYVKTERPSEGEAYDDANAEARKAGFDPSGPSVQHRDYPNADGNVIITHTYSKKLSKGASVDTQKKALARRTKLAAAQKDLKKLSSKLVATRDAVKMAAAEANVKSKLHRLAAGGKITGAEIKNMDVKKLAKLSADHLAIITSAFEAREPVIRAGQIGTAAATNFSDVGRQLEAKQTKRLRAEIKGDLRRMGAKLKADDDDKEPSRKEMAQEIRDEKKLEDGETETAVETVPQVDPAVDTEAMQGQLDELATQVSRIAGIVSDLVDETQVDESGEASDDEGELSAEEKEDAALEADDKDDDDSKELASDDKEADDDKDDDKKSE